MGRYAALAGLAAGLAASPWAGAPAVGATLAGLVAAGLLLAFRPSGGRPAAWAWLGLLAAATGLAGLGLGAARIEAIDSGALDLESGARVAFEGHVDAVPRRSGGVLSVVVDSPDGRILLEAGGPAADLATGTRIRAIGRAREPDDWERSHLERRGIADVLVAERIRAGGPGRTGATGALDRVRARAEAALGRGVPTRAAELLRGFVLGQDDRIDSRVRDSFERSGLAHLLAVSGQNVLLLVLLASAILGLLGLSLRLRLAAMLALIAVYVPIAGAGPSIQRAGVMGAAAVVAALASRPRARAYALLLAATVTLALNPRASADVGWQLSFFAVAGIFCFARPLRDAFAGAEPGRSRAALAEGAALTVAATLATTPLMALHFGVVSLVSLPANLLALPAVAPVMWLGMLVAAAGQFSWLPVEALNAPAGALAGYIAQVADWLAAPGWAQVDARLEGAASLFACLAVLGLTLAVGLRVATRRRGLRPGAAAVRAARGSLALVAVGLLLIAVVGRLVAGGEGPADPPGLELRMLDVGQGDALLLDPADGAPVLIDAGPPGGAASRAVGELGEDGLAALVLTHPQADHAGGAPELLGELDVGALAFAVPDRAASAAARASGTRAISLSRGERIRSGSLRLEVLWPPAASLATRPLAEGAARAGATEDPNRLSLVMLARWGSFRLLLTGDAEAEAVPIDPGPVDVLKLAHHGSDDPGLAGLLARTSPQLALISVGAGNPYGHPTPATLATLEEAGVAVLRTDLHGELVIEVDRDRWSVG